MQRSAAVWMGALALALAASADASTPPVAPEVKRAEGFSYPTVSLSCHIDGQTCEATASGGSGSGYSFEWSWPFTEQYDADGVSGGDVTCIPYWGWRTISVTVTDSWGRTGSASTQFFCPA